MDNGIATLTLTSGTLTNAATGTIDSDLGGGTGIRRLTAQLNNQGLLEATNSIDINAVGADHVNSGTINVSAGTMQFVQTGSTPTFLNTSTGVINVTGTGILLINGGGGSAPNTVTNDGTFNIAAGRSFNIMGGSTLTNFSGSSLTGGTYNVAGTLRFTDADIVTNAATIVLDGVGSIRNHNNALAMVNLAANTGSFTIQNLATFTTTGALTNSGTVTVGTGSTLATAAGANYTQTAGSTVLVNVSSTLDPGGIADIQGGNLSGIGTVSGNVQSQGQVGPGVAGAGVLGVLGDYTQVASGDLAIELGGTTAGSQYDQLGTSGAVTLGGDLVVSLINSFFPAPGNTFVIVNNTGAGAVSGTFAGLAEGATINVGGADLQISYVGGDGNDVVLTAVDQTNAAPVANNDAYTTAEDTTLTVVTPGVLGNDTDADGDTLTAVLVAGPASGTLTLNANGSFSYTPSANFSGSDSFTYRANDGSLDSNIATVSITVTAVNDAPVAVNDSYSTAQNTPLTVPAPGVLGNDTDADGDTLSASLVTGPTNGTLVFNSNGSFTYTPNVGFSGPDSFTYQASDGVLSSNTATVSLNVTDVNTAPVALDDAYSTNEDTTLTVAAPGVLVNDTDADGDTLTAVLVAGPSSGTLTLNANGSFSYTPAANFSGSDSFTYRANDGSLDSNIATVSITVTAVNDAPVAVSDSYSTAQNTPLTVPAPGVLGNDTDADGNTLSASLVTGPTNGTLVFNSNGSFTYTPTLGFSGPDSFTYQASDGALSSNLATVSLTVTATNAAPAAANDAYTTSEGDTLTVAPPGVLGNDTDADGDTLTAVLVAGPASGTLVLNANGSFSYTPDAGFSGLDSFTYRASDGTATSNVATVSITVEEDDVGEIPDFDISDDNSAAIVDDPLTGGQALLVVGTESRDVIIVEPRPGHSNQVRVKRNGKVIGTFRTSDFSRVAVFALGGNDTVIINSRINVSAELHGGNGSDQLFGGKRGDLLFGENGNDKLFGLRGNDRLYGGAGDDRLFGGQGNDLLFGEDGRDRLYGESGHDALVGGADQDQLYGGSGRDVLIGGSGIDRLFGQADQDILITEKTDFDEDEEALLAILAEWKSSRSRQVRIQNLTDGTGSADAQNVPYFLQPGVTIHEDSSADDHVFGFNRRQDWRP